MSDERVNAFDRYDRPINIDASDVDALKESGGRLASEVKPDASIGNILATGAGAAASAAKMLTNPMGMHDALMQPIINAGVDALMPGASGARMAREQVARDNDEMGQAFVDGMSTVNAGVLAGGSAGLGAGLIRKELSLISPEAAKNYENWATTAETTNPALYKATELASMVGTAYGGGLIRLGAAAPAALIGRAGLGAESLAARGLAAVGVEGTNFATRALGTAVKLGAQGATEGALYGASNTIGESLLHDHELSAEKLRAAVGEGAMSGAVLGAALGGSGSLLASAGRAGVSALAGVIKKSPLVAEGGVAAGLENIAAKQAFESLGASKPVVSRIMRGVDGGTDAVGRALLDEGLLGASLKDAAIGGRADAILPRITGRLDEIGSQLERLTTTPARVKLTDALESAALARKELEGLAGGRPALRAYETAVSDVVGALESRGAIAADGTVSVNDLLVQRKSLDQWMRNAGMQAGGKPTPLTDALSDLRQGMERTGLDAIETAAQAEGRSVKADIIDLKRRYMLLSRAEEAATAGAAKFVTNNGFGLRESIGALTAIGTGHAPAGIAMAIGGKLARERGNAVAAVFLRQLADSTAAANAMRRVDVAIDGAAKGILTPKQISRSSVVTAATDAVSVRRRAQEAMHSVNEAQRDPNAYADRVTSETKPVASWAPNVAAQYTAKATGGIGYLATKLPIPLSTDPLVSRQESNVTDMDARKFLRAYEAVQNPVAALRKMEGGEVTPEAVEALKATSPRLFSQLRMRTYDMLAERMAKGDPVPYNQRITLSLLFDMPGDRSMVPAVMQTLQANTVATPQKGAAPNTGAQTNPPSRPINFAPPPSALDRIEQG